MFLQIFFIFVSLACGGAFWWWLIPALQEQNNFLYKLLVAPYPFFKKFLPFPDYTYFILFSIFVSILTWIMCEIIYFFHSEKPLTSRGSAHWATKKDVKDLMTNKGVPIGRFNKKILRDDQYHLVTCAGTGAGKGVGQIIPTLLEYPESLVCLDIKGENYAVTSRRRSEFGPCYVLNPFGDLGIKSNSFNWLDTINIDDESCISKAQKIASELVGDSNGINSENHFDEQAKRLIQGLILAVCTENENRNICTVSDLIHKLPLSELCAYMKSKGNAAFDFISKTGSQFANNTNDRETSGILSTAQRATNFLDNPKIRNTILKSDFDINQLPDKIMSIYMIMQQTQISENKAYIRVFFDLAFSSIMDRTKRGKYQVLFLLDEIAQLGYMKIFPDQIAIARGKGGKLWFFFQDLDQLYNNYGKSAGTILANSTQIYYGCNELDTAKKISDLLGKQTIKEKRERGKYDIIGRDLLTPQEIMEVAEITPIIKMRGKPPIKITRLTYYDDKEYKGLYDKNPLT